MSPPTVLRPALKSGVLEAAGWVSWGAGVAAGFRVTEIAGLDVWLSELLTLMDGVEIFLNVTLMAGVGLYCMAAHTHRREAGRKKHSS